MKKGLHDLVSSRCVRHVLARVLFIFLSLTFLLALPSYALRIISLAPNLTEMVYAVGAGNELVGVSEYSDFPPEAKKIPRVSRLEKINVEKILLLKPDLVLGWPGGGEDATVNQLKSFGISVEWIPTETLLDIPKALVQVGILTHHPEEGKKVADSFLAQYQQLESYSAAQKGLPPKKVFLELFDSPLYTAGNKSFLMNILSLCGAESAFPGVNSEASTVSLESVIEENPDVIVIFKPAKASVWAVWPMINAVKNHRVYEIDPNILARPGPRVLEGAKQVCEWVK